MDAGKDLMIECVTTEPRAVVTLQVRLKGSNEMVNGSVLFKDRLIIQVCVPLKFLFSQNKLIMKKLKNFKDGSFEFKHIF